MMYRGGKCTAEEGSVQDESVDLESQELSHFDIGALKVAGTCISNITELNLNYNSLSTLPVDLSSALPRIQILSLSGNDLKELPSSIGSLEELRILSANENEIAVLSTALFQLHRLEELHLLGNRLKHLSPEICHLKNLKNLTVEDNQLSDFPSTLGDLENLHTLEASENHLESLPVNFGNLRNLAILNIGRNKLLELPDSFGDLPSLQYVDVSNNYLQELTPRLASASRCLVKFTAADNLFKKFPPWIAELTHIQEIYLGNNYIEHELPENFGTVSGNTLRHMDVGANFLDQLPEGIGQLRNVETLHFGSHIMEIERRAFQNGNRIEQLPESFGQMMNLRHLRLDENHLHSLPNSFGDLSSLEYLDLGQNVLKRLPASFGCLLSLKTCLLSKNNIECLPENFGNLRLLERLRINANQLKELPASFEQLVNLQTLDLVDNHLREFPACLNKLTSLVRVALDDNDFELDIPEVLHLDSRAKYPADGIHKFVRTTEFHDTDKMTSALANAVKKGDSIWKSHLSNDQDMLTATHLQNEGSDGGTSESCSHTTDVEFTHGLDDVIHEPEDWDMEVEDNNPFSYDDIPVYQHKTLRSPVGTNVLKFNFVPSDDHPPSLPVPDLDLDFEDGQFEDAD
nr:leucine-rich repeat-containing protein 1-like [Lytechinus pictus]XP_054762645.1 leucine-rich repeat-containing protein 1-like [Lytechinus pictus]